MRKMLFGQPYAGMEEFDMGEFENLPVHVGDLLCLKVNTVKHQEFTGAGAWTQFRVRALRGKGTSEDWARALMLSSGGGGSIARSVGPPGVQQEWGQPTGFVEVRFVR